MKSLGCKLSDVEIASRYYRERVRPYLIRYPVTENPQSKELEPEGLETWEIGSPQEDLDWFESLLVNPEVIPGITTVQRIYGESPGSEPEKEPYDLDLYIDSSGSMPNPASQVSYLALAGAIIALSAIRAGAKVQANLWSDTREFLTTNGFISNSQEIMNILVSYFGGGTAFPLHKLRKTYIESKPKRKVHILIISDDGVDTLFQKDEKGNSGEIISMQSLLSAGGGGTMALNIQPATLKKSPFKKMQEQGWSIFPVRQWEELILFAKNFSRSLYKAKAEERVQHGI